MNKKRFNYVCKGLMRSCILTLIVMIIFSIVNFFIPSTEAAKSPFILILTLVSIMYGAFYASKKSGQKGWLLGVMVALMYMIILYIISLAGGRNFALTARDYTRVLLGVVVGALSGMLGINM